MVRVYLYRLKRATEYSFLAGSGKDTLHLATLCTRCAEAEWYVVQNRLIDTPSWACSLCGAATGEYIDERLSPTQPKGTEDNGAKKETEVQTSFPLE